MKIKSILAACMAAGIIAVFSLSPGVSSGAIQSGAPENTASINTGAAQIKSKDEIVYARLAPDGAAQAIYTVNHFSLENGGSVVDYGNYDTVANLTNTDTISHSGDTVSFSSNEENYYYQGNMANADLPWAFGISYSLNGKEMPATDIAGADGKLKIHITSQQNTKVNKTFYENYMLQISVTLDTEKCSNIAAPGASMASAGKNTVAAFSVLPGSDADYDITADVKDFEMTGIEIAAVPYSMDMEFPDMDGLDDLEELPDAISELNEGVATLADGTSTLADGATKITGGSAGIKNGLDLLNGNSALLKDSSTQINGALSKIATALGNNSLEEIDLTKINQLPDGLRGLAGGLRSLADGLSKLKDGFVPAHATLSSAIQAIPDVPQSEITALYGAVAGNPDPNMTSYLDHLVDAYTAAQTVKGTYAVVKDAFTGVETTIDQSMLSLSTMADQLDAIAQEMGGALGKLDGLSDFGSLVSGLQALSGQYTQFHDGLILYADGVSTLASNYSTFHAGLESLSDGTSELAEGVGELHDGTDTLNNEIADMPQLIQDEIDKMKEEYMPTDFDPISFTSSKNTDTEFVQFIIQSEGIEKPEAEETASTDEDQPQTFWDRLKGLFTKES